MNQVSPSTHIQATVITTERDPLRPLSRIVVGNVKKRLWMASKKEWGRDMPYRDLIDLLFAKQDA